MALKSSWQVAAASGEPHSIIRVRNLQATAQVGRDAWGRTGKVQPILISATISLREPFDKASAEDSVNNNSTVHYGVLSKAILDSVQTFPDEVTERTLRCLLDHILKYLTGMGLAATHSDSRGGNLPHILEKSALKALGLEVILPKASLIGGGVSLSVTTVYTPSGNAEEYATVLKLHELRIPTLIGVNPNERLAKQIVVANIELDSWSFESDLYNELEELAVKTLEALATHVGRRILKYFLSPIVVHRGGGGTHERIKICLEKPTAVTFAEAPAVEILIDSNPDVNGFARHLLRRNMKARKPPFPLQGSLKEWIRENGPEAVSGEETDPL